MRRLFAVALAGLSLAATGARAQADDHLIVPGERIGAIRLGMTEAELYRALGDPSESYTYGGNAGYAYLGGKLLATFRGGRLVGAAVQEPSYATREGFRPSASRLALVALYGQPPKVTRPKGALNFDYYCYPGFTAMVLNTGAVSRIEIGDAPCK